MKPSRSLTALLLILAVSCASAGAGDPIVVKAEDVLTNSLSVYQAAMNQHFATSTKESAAVYKTMEDARVGFPVAWQALYNAVKQYKVDRNPDKINAALAAIQTIISGIQPLIGAR